MNTIPPGGFTLNHFHRAYSTPSESSHERLDTTDVFRETHRGPRALTTKNEWFHVWNGISCTCCTLCSDDEEIHACEDNYEAVLKRVTEAKKDEKSYDLVFIKYESQRHNDIDKLIADIAKASPETKVFLLVYRDEKPAEDLRDKGYFALSGNDMMEQARYDFFIAEALGDDGIKRLEK